MSVRRHCNWRYFPAVVTADYPNVDPFWNWQRVVSWFLWPGTGRNRLVLDGRVRKGERHCKEYRTTICEGYADRGTIVESWGKVQHDGEDKEKEENEERMLPIPSTERSGKKRSFSGWDKLSRAGILARHRYPNVLNMLLTMTTGSNPVVSGILFISTIKNKKIFGMSK
jgi:hypothetical protein